MPLQRAADLLKVSAEVLRAPRRVKPSMAAQQWLQTEKGPWIPDFVPYCIEPLDLLSSRQYQGIVFVGPARTGKTMGLILGGVAYVVKCAPGDMLIVQMSQDAARDFSRQDLDRALRYSPELNAMLSPRRRDDNVYDKFFRSGVMLKLGWPAVSQLSSKTLQYVFLTDYDRPKNADNVDGEGTLWGLAMKRTQTYMSSGKCLAESSPGEEQTNPNWVPASPHEAPPVKGILSVYNAGTRARWYWTCLHCGEPFEAKPGLGAFPAVPEFDEILKAVKKHDVMSLAEEWAKVGCPHCGALHEPEDRSALNRNGRWLHEGESLVNGEITGERRRTNIASYWLGGVAAAYQQWTSIVHNYLQAALTYTATSDEGPLRETTNTDQGAPYLPIAIKRCRTADELVQRVEDWPRGLVPDGVRFLTAAIDVQSNRFPVMVEGWGDGLESWIIDRFSLTVGPRIEGTHRAPIDPAAYVEDWEVLVENVVTRIYRRADGSEMSPVLTLCDSGGKSGVTDKAYEFWRRMRDRGLGRRFMLVKGDSNRNSPRVRENWPDARARKDRQAGRGDVPVWMLNVNSIKDGVAGDLGRELRGPGFVHIPAWIDYPYFNEVTAETRTDRGWVNEHRQPNEAFDLHCYNRAACIILRAEAINWDNPPEWAVTEKKEVEEKPAKRQEPPRSWVRQW